MTACFIPGIRAVHIVRCSDLPSYLMELSMAGGDVALSVPSERVDLCGGMPVLKRETSVVNGSPQEKSTLEFATRRPLPVGERLAFVVTCASGRQLLVGTREPNYPVITSSVTTGTPSGEGAFLRYKITHTAPKSVLSCLL